jgi:hypothetical protein
VRELGSDDLNAEEGLPSAVEQKADVIPLNPGTYLTYKDSRPRFSQAATLRD